MHVPKNYFHDRLILLILSLNTFVAAITSLLITFRLQGGSTEGLVGQYHANLRLSAFEPGSAATFVGFIIFCITVLVLHTVLSMRMYHRRRDYSVAILWMGLFLLVLTLIVSNSLLAVVG